MNKKMKTFDVYKRWPIEPAKALGCRVWDAAGTEYLDFYGGHAVISIGHSHPEYVTALQRQAERIGFYSNAVQNPLQEQLAERLGRACGYEDYTLFLSNSGAEANENALKLASFHTGRRRVLAFHGAFHGRTSGAVAATDNPALRSPFNLNHDVTFVAQGDESAVEQELAAGDYAAVIVEGIQGVAGIHEPSDDFLRFLRAATERHGTALILDEIQSGYGRTGQFFAHQRSGIRPDIVTTAKGMGNGFPIGGTLISPAIKPTAGMLGTTFGGNYLACAAATAVLAVMEADDLTANAAAQGNYLMEQLSAIAARHSSGAIKELRGRGLMIGIEMGDGYAGVRDRLLCEDRIFTGGAGAGVIRLLPPLCVSRAEIDRFLTCFEAQIGNIQ